MKELSFSFEEAAQEARQAFRTSVPGLEARDTSSGRAYPVHDISAGGMSLEDKGRAIEPGELLCFDLCFKGRALIAGLAARGVRHGQDRAGMKFETKSPRQEERLDKLVLEVQKYHIAKNKTGGSHIDHEP